MSNDLLPCPFCGSGAVLKQIGNDHTKTRTVEIKCSNAMCRATMVNKALRNSMPWLIEVSAKSWNTRPISPPSLPEQP